VRAATTARQVSRKEVRKLVLGQLAIEYQLCPENITAKAEPTLYTVAAKITTLLLPVSEKARANLEREMRDLIPFNKALLIARGVYETHDEISAAEALRKAQREASSAGAAHSDEEDIRALIAGGENAKVEFKSSARWDMRENKKNPAMEQVLLKTMAAFLNSEGGTLLLGVSDDGTIVGLEHDYQTLQKKNADGYELFLRDFLLGHFGKDCSPSLRISIHQLDGSEVCRVVAQPSARPVWLKEGADEPIYIRTGNSTRRLTTREALEYCKRRWQQ
jgi:hypothetical protein